MNERIKTLRKTLGLTLEKFGSQVGVTKTAISRIEKGERNITDQMFKSVCREFNVNEEWLRTGEGDMFIKVDDNTQLTNWTSSILADEPTSFRRRFASMIASLTDEDWKWLESKANMLIQDSKSEPTVAELEEAYIKSRLNSAKKKTSSVSSITNENDVHEA